MTTLSRAANVRTVAYWASTSLAALALGASGAAELTHAPEIMTSLRHLGYPTYLATILGTWELLGAVAILAPRLAQVKEWAYAGMVFTLSGAALSHAASGDPAGKVFVPLVLLGVVLVSWSLRPARRAPLPPTRWRDRGRERTTTEDLDAPSRCRDRSYLPHT
jgi:uncharacterized membrane protein YphA (DoxX/SURF4 family)